MALKLSKVFIFNVIVLKVFTSALHPSLKQYLHLTGVGPSAHSAGLSSLPNVGVTPRQSVPNPGLSALSGLSLPALISALAAVAPTQQYAGLPALKTQPAPPPTPVVPTSRPNTPPANVQNGGLDPSIINNLAIALQLLIVSNILNSPLPENGENPIYEIVETVKNMPLPLSPTQKTNSRPAPTQYIDDYNEVSYQPIPNLNFVGTSSFSDLAVVGDPYTKQNVRNNYQLMSPYEALSPNSPYSDPILQSPYGSIITSKKDFQSPYAMMESDIFSMNDF